MRIPRTLATAAALAALAIAASPAQATISDREWFNDPIAYDYDCGYPVSVTGTLKELFMLRLGKHDDRGAFAILDRIRFSERHTNTATGEWFTVEGTSTIHDVKMTRVEGNVFDFTSIEAGQPLVVKDSDGNVVSRDRGTIHLTYRVDVGDDDVFGGTWIEDVELWFAGPHPDGNSDIWARDYCGIADGLIG